MARISDYSGGKSTTQPQSTVTVDPYYTVNPVTGLSPAQEEAKAAQEAAQKALMEVTGTKDIAAAQAAAAAKNVAQNPFVVQAQKDLTAAQAAAKTAADKAAADAKAAADKAAAEAAAKAAADKATVTPKQTYTAPDGRIFTDLNEYNAYLSKLKANEKLARGESAFALLKAQFDQYGMGALVNDVIKYKVEGLSDAEMLLKLRTESDAYKRRFAANEARVNKGLRALSEAEYILKEDAYQEKMRQYGLPESYYARGEMGRQAGFEKLIAGDVSAAELEDRLQTAYNRVINAAPEVSQALKTFYPDITNGDILAYTLDPEKALTEIRRKVTAAEIGGAAIGAGLATSMARAEQLGQYGVSAQQAQQGYQTIAGGLERGRQLSGLYQQPEYTQTTAEQEIFGLPSATEAARQRKKLTKLEQATFGGQTGMTGGALARDRAGTF